MSTIRIGEIYTDKPPQHQDVNILYLPISEYDKRSGDVPTLLVGYHNVKHHHPNMDILDRKLSDTEYWTFLKSEYVSYYSCDTYDFIKQCYNKFISDVSYFFVDIILSDDEKIKKILKEFSNHKGTLTSFKEGDRLYVLCDKIIFGFNLYQIRFLKKDESKFINRIKSLSENFIDSMDSVKDVILPFMEFYNEDIKYIPYIISRIHKKTLSELQTI